MKKHYATPMAKLLVVYSDVITTSNIKTNDFDPDWLTANVGV